MTRSAPANVTVSQDRADKVKDRLNAAGVTDMISARGVSGDRFTRVEGLGASEPLTGRPHSEWRRVQIIMAGFPAGAQRPIPGTPTGVTHVPGAPVSSGEPCVDLLTTTAWT